MIRENSELAQKRKGLFKEIYESVEIAHQKDISFGFPGGRGWRKIYAVDLIIPEDRSYRGNRLQFQL